MSLTELTGNPRHDQLLMLIAERGYMNIDELANLLDVSTQTVRRDIRKLSEQGLITRHHGGAGRASSVVNTAFEQREVSQTEEKKAIAEAVADYIPDGSTIFITIGTTVEHVARALLNHNHLRIITNSLRVAHILYHNPRFEVMVPGGTLRSHNSGIDLNGINVKYRYEFTDTLGMVTSFSYAGDKNRQITRYSDTRWHEDSVRNRWFSVMAGPSVRVNEWFSAYAMAGVAYSRVSTFSGDYLRVTDNKGKKHDVLTGSDDGRHSNTSLAWGAGVQFNPTESVAIDVAYEGSGSGDWRTDGFIVGVGYKF